MTPDEIIEAVLRPTTVLHTDDYSRFGNRLKENGETLKPLMVLIKMVRSHQMYKPLADVATAARVEDLKLTCEDFMLASAKLVQRSKLESLSASKDAVACKKTAKYLGPVQGRVRPNFGAHVKGAVAARCTWCGESHCLGECIANGQKWKCKGCYSTERWLQSSYKSTNRSHQWTSMSMDERRQEILKNRSSHGQRGTKRQFVAREEASVVDSVGSRASTPYLNKVQFKRLGTKRWAWSAATAEAKWRDALNDARVPKSKDEEGWITVAKYSAASLESGRTLNHSRGLVKTDDIQNVGQLNSDTGLFNLSDLPSLPGLQNMQAKSGMAKKRAKKMKADNGSNPPPLQDDNVGKAQNNLKVKNVRSTMPKVASAVAVAEQTLDKLTASFVDVCAFSPALLKESEECTDKDFLERFEEDIADAEGRLSPTAEHVKQRVVSHGSDDVPQKKEIVKYSQCHKSLMQACTKLQQSLVKQSASVQNKRARDKKADARKLANEKKLEVQRCAALEDEQQGIRGLPCFEHVPDLESAPAESSKPHLDLDGVDSIDISGEEFSCCTVAAPDSQGVFLPLVEIQKAEQEATATAEEESEAASASASKAAAKQTWHKLDFEEWDQWLDARVSNGSAAVLLDKMNWATKKYLMLPEHRCKALDNALSATVHLCPSESLYIGLTPMGWPHLQLQLQGRRYVFAVPVNDLSKLYSEQQNEQPGDLVELCNFLRGLSKDEIQQANGAWCVLQPNMAVFIPAGWAFVAGDTKGSASVHMPFATANHLLAMSPEKMQEAMRLTSETAAMRALNKSLRDGMLLRDRIAGAAGLQQPLPLQPLQAGDSAPKDRDIKKRKSEPETPKSDRKKVPAGLEELAPTAAEDMDVQNMLDEIDAPDADMAAASAETQKSKDVELRGEAEHGSSEAAIATASTIGDMPKDPAEEDTEMKEAIGRMWLSWLSFTVRGKRWHNSTAQLYISRVHGGGRQFQNRLKKNMQRLVSRRKQMQWNAPLLLRRLAVLKPAHRLSENGQLMLHSATAMSCIMAALETPGQGEIGKASAAATNVKSEGHAEDTSALIEAAHVFGDGEVIDLMSDAEVIDDDDDEKDAEDNLRASTSIPPIPDPGQGGVAEATRQSAVFCF
ncbi:unnamed protein product [Symbiodinium necroappetens]|uniref:JmjC domain-containing protein n=1 Tax=Symbiodinium necroappetens TaxID=1628268 RepID=A0A812S8E9_9DINO|nr:unnamed protein product [Symbiodinium necroappetens]